LGRSPHYRRYLLQQKSKKPGSFTEDEMIARALEGLDDGKGSVFVSHLGEVYPSGFLPLSAAREL
jgi:MoaA/NifB/PqqE/SkfB family radical SAM enzyme